MKKHKIAFISLPYSSPDSDTVDYRIDAAREVSLGLLSELGAIPIAPMLLGNDLLNHPNAKDIATDFKHWEDFSLAFLGVSDIIILVLLDGWKESIGMQAEYEAAIAKGLQLVFLDQEYIIRTPTMLTPALKDVNFF